MTAGIDALQGTPTTAFLTEPNVAVKVFTVGVDGEGIPLTRLVAFRKHELPNEVVQGGSEVVDDVAADDAPTERRLVDYRAKVHGVPSSVEGVIHGFSAGIRLEEGMQFAVKRVAVLLAFLTPLAVGAADLFSAVPEEVRDEPWEPNQTGPETAVVAGQTSSGKDWRVVAYESDQGLCVNIDYESPSGANGGGCGFDIEDRPGTADDRAAGVVTSIDGSVNTTFVYGPAAAGVDRVEVTTKNGKVLELPTKAAPANLGSNASFFATSVPGEAYVDTVVAKNARGEVMGRQKLRGGPPPDLPREQVIDEPAHAPH